MKHVAPYRRLTLFVALLALLAGVPSALAQRGGAVAGRNSLPTFQQQHRELHAKLAGSLGEIAAFCDERELPEAAAQVRGLAVPLDPQVLRFAPLPTNVQPEIGLGLPEDERRWRVQLRYHQQTYAKALFDLAQRTLNAGFASFAWELVREVAHHDPDHRAARRVLGFVRQEDQWLTRFEQEMARRSRVWHDRFGWLPRADVERYEKGERNFNGRWMSADQEAVLRRDFRNAWEIVTDNFRIRTNHSLERGVEVATALEDFHTFFSQTFAGVFNTPEQMKRLFSGAGGIPPTQVMTGQYVVHYYATRDEFNQRLIAKIPQIAITNGLYYPGDKVSYFYHDPDADTDSTLFHEATHQFLYESVPKHRPVAEREHFWIVEGIACYMESFEREGGRVSVGDPQHVRFQAARYRLLHDDYYVPLARFAEMGMQVFQGDANIARNYSQASGLAHFFMHYDGGRYRDALIEHLAQLYAVPPRRTPGVQSLADLTEVDYAELDRQYADYLRAMEAALNP